MLSLLNRLWVSVARRTASPPAVVTGNLAGVTIYDQQGNVRDEAWLVARYGNVEVIRSAAPAGSTVFRVSELRQKEGPATLVVKTLSDKGAPMSGVNVLFTWPGADPLPTWEPPPERWYDGGVYGPTNDNGDVGFGMGTGAYYDPKTQQGPHSVWVGRPSTYTDLVDGLGMLPFTVHDHLDVVFKLAAGDEPEPPEPPEPPSDDVLEYLDAMNKTINEIRDLLKAGWKVEPL